MVDRAANALGALSELLEEEGYEVRTARDRGAALEAAASFHPDVALLDANQPSEKAAPALAEATIFMSTRAPTRSQRDLPFLRKPIDLDELFAAVAFAVIRARTAKGSD